MPSGGRDERLDPYGDSVRRLLWLEQLRGNGLFAEQQQPQPTKRPALPPGRRQWTPLARALAAIGDRWTLLIVLALAPGAKRLSTLREHLPGISTGVLNRHLQTMVEQNLLFRQRFSEVPPRVEYKLAPGGEALLPIVVALARWGMSYMWTSPEPRERVEIAALLRLLPTLLDGTGLPDCVIETAIELGEAPERERERQLFNIVEGRIEAVAPDSLTPDTCIAGTQLDWAQALGTRCEIDALLITGDEQLALRLLHALRPKP